MLRPSSEIRRADIDGGKTECGGGGDDEVVVLCLLEGVHRFSGGGRGGGAGSGRTRFRFRFVEDSFVDRIGDGVVDEFGE